MPEAFGQKEAARMQRSIADDPKDRDWDEHVRRVSQDSALKTPRRSVAPDLCGPPRALIDKVGGSR
jgi:hypothetical protein